MSYKYKVGDKVKVRILGPLDTRVRCHVCYDYIYDSQKVMNGKVFKIKKRVTSGYILNDGTERRYCEHSLKKIKGVIILAKKRTRADKIAMKEAEKPDIVINVTKLLNKFDNEVEKIELDEKVNKEVRDLNCKQKAQVELANEAIGECIAKLNKDYEFINVSALQVDIGDSQLFVMEKNIAEQKFSSQKELLGKHYDELTSIIEKFNSKVEEIKEVFPDITSNN